MSILPQQKYSLRSLHLVPRCHHRSGRLPAHVTCLAVTTTTTKIEPKSNSEALIVEPRLADQTPLAKPISSSSSSSIPTSSPPLLNDPSLQSTWTHRAWVASGCTTMLVSLAKSAVAAAGSHTWLEPMLAGYIGYVLADLGSGVYHWGIDNYGDESTPMFGRQIESFQGHHKWPWTITRRQFANNLHGLAQAITFTVLPLNIICNGATINAFISIFAGCIMFSQQFHSWAHGTKSKLPPLVVALQDVGVLVSRSQHAVHHRPPYNNNYCIVSGVWNEFLDKNKVFEALEMVLFFRFGLRPRSWSEPNSDWTEEPEISSEVIVY